jgi:serine/threonine-protein kinase
MAEVYLAHDEVLDRDVALKTLRKPYAYDEEFVERFRQEARSAARLSHPNIVSVYDQGRSEDGSYYMAMEYVPRGTLKDRIRRDGALAPEAAAGVALQIAGALSAAHERGVIHRDIKPQNILVTPTGDIKVADFGIARAASAASMTRTGNVLGTAGYMSPEQAKGEPVGPQSDLYSLGVVLYEMLTGNLPYEADSDVAMALKHINEPPYSPRDANPEVSEALDALTMKLLAKDPRDRYASAHELIDDLGRVRSGLPPAARSEKTERMTVPFPPSPEKQTRSRRTVRQPVTTPVGAPRGGRRRRGRLVPALAALLVGVALLGGLAWTLMRDSGAPEPSGSQDKSGAADATVPEVAGLVPSEAERTLSEESLKLGRQQETPNAALPAGTVAGQNPVKGTEVQSGTAVDVGVSTGPNPAPAQSPSASQPTPAPQPVSPQPVQATPAQPQSVQATLIQPQNEDANGDNGGNKKKNKKGEGQD